MANDFTKRTSYGRFKVAFSMLMNPNKRWSYKTREHEAYFLRLTRSFVLFIYFFVLIQ
jgi:hypothetical protein